jgi:hypothetical protein
VLVGLFIALGAPLLCLWFARRDNRWLARFISVGGGLLLGAGIAMIFLLPMVLEVPSIQVSKGATNLANVLAASFLQPYQLFLPATAPDMSDLNRSLPDSLGLVTGILAALGLIGLLYRRQYRLALAWGAAAAFVIFLLLPISTSFWLTMPLLGQLRFPGRVLRLGAIFFGLLGASSLLLLPRRWQTSGAIVVGVVIIVSALPILYPSRELLDFSHLSAADFIRYEQQTYSFGGTSYDEFKPIWGDHVPSDVPSDLDAYVTDPLHINVKDYGDATVTPLDDQHFQVNSSQPFELHFRQFYFPGWTASVDGQPTPVFPNAEFGLLSLNVPTGEHVVSLSRPGTLAENIAPWLSLVIAAPPAVLCSVNVVVPPSKFWIKAEPAVLVLKKDVSPKPMLVMLVGKFKLEALALLKKINVPPPVWVKVGPKEVVLKLTIPKPLMLRMIPETSKL